MFISNLRQGFNAELRPVFCIDRIAKDEVKEYDPKGKVKLITVVDCVGKVDRNQFVGYVNGKPYYGSFPCTSSNR